MHLVHVWEGITDRNKLL